VSYGRRGSKAATLREAVHLLLLEHVQAGELPTSSRFLYYELVGRGLLDKTKTRRKGRSDDQNLSDASKWLRDEGMVTWRWIVDETRSLAEWEYGETLRDFLEQQINVARIDCWGGAQPPLIVCESRTFGGVLRRGIAPEYLCPVTATNGQVGGFLHTNLVPVLKGNDRLVLYVGDFDLSGDQCEANTRRVLVREAGDRDWQRVALTAEQVDRHKLNGYVIEKVDRRYRPPRKHKAIEVESLGQSVVVGMVRAALDALLPEPLADVEARLGKHAKR
jgi:hypothetical protein